MKKQKDAELHKLKKERDETIVSLKQEKEELTKEKTKLNDMLKNNNNNTNNSNNKEIEQERERANLAEKNINLLNGKIDQLNSQISKYEKLHSESRIQLDKVPMLEKSVSDLRDQLSNEKRQKMELESKLKQLNAANNTTNNNNVTNISEKEFLLLKKENLELKSEIYNFKLKCEEYENKFKKMSEIKLREKPKEKEKNYYLLEQRGESCEISRVEMCLMKILRSSPEVDFNEVMQLNEIFKNDSGRRKFTQMLDAHMKEMSSMTLSDNSFELLLYLINTTLTEMEQSDHVDLISARVLMLSSNQLKRVVDGSVDYVQEYIKGYKVWNNLKFWSELYWDELLQRQTRGDYEKIDEEVAVMLLELFVSQMIHWGVKKNEIIQFVNRITEDHRDDMQLSEKNVKWLKDKMASPEFWVDQKERMKSSKKKELEKQKERGHHNEENADKTRRKSMIGGLSKLITKSEEKKVTEPSSSGDDKDKDKQAKKEKKLKDKEEKEKTRREEKDARKKDREKEKEKQKEREKEREKEKEKQKEKASAADPPSTSSTSSNDDNKAANAKLKDRISQWEQKAQ